MIELLLATQLLNHVAAAIGIILTAKTLAPFVTKSLLAVKEDEMISEPPSSLPRHHTGDFEQGARADPPSFAPTKLNSLKGFVSYGLR